MNKDLIAIVRFQGPKSNGIRVYKMTPYLGILQDKGYKVALVTDGRMSVCIWKSPCGNTFKPRGHISGGEIAKIKDGDILELDAESTELNHHVDFNTWDKRELATKNSMNSEYGTGRELLNSCRKC